MTGDITLVYTVDEVQELTRQERLAPVLVLLGSCLHEGLVQFLLLVNDAHGARLSMIVRSVRESLKLG